MRFPDGTLADFESGALPAGWTTGGSSSWSVVADAPHSDEGACFIHAAKAGPVSGGQATFLETVRTVTEGDLYFHLWVEYQSPSEYGVRLIIDYNNDGTDDYTGPLMSSDPKSGVSGVPYPAAYPESIAVGATSNLDCRSHYSQFGPELDVVAPSNAGFLNPGIETTDRTGAAGYDPGNYTLAAGSSGFGGTSSATSLAAGIVGLLLSRNPSLTVAEVRQALESTADKVGPEPYVGGRNDRYGFGRLDAEQALLAVSACGFITVSPAVLPSGVVGALYGQSLVASGGAPAYGSAVTLGSLPPGLTLSTGGLLAGTPTTPGSYSFSVTATDADGCSGYRGYTVVIVPSFSVNDVSVTEGQSGTTTATFTVRLSSACEMPVSVDYATANGTASAGSDYVAASGTLSFPPGSTARSIAVTVNGDTASEPSETFFVNLSWARSEAIAAIADAQGVGTIVDDEMPSLAVNDVTVTEGHSGTTSATFTVSLSVASGQTVTVSYATSNGTASSDSDYAAASGTLSFPPGSTAQTIAIGVNGDTATEPGETFFVNLSGATNAPIADAQAVGTIVNDDVPSLSISDVTVTERNGGTTGGTFTVSLSAASGQAVTVRYATADGTASAASDYMAVSGTLTFPPGWTTASLVVPARGDTWLEPDETFLVNLSGAVNATITDAQGVGTIVDDDLPSLFIGELSVTEGHSGTRSATFNVSLIPASEQTVTVDYATENGTASAGSDYVAASGTLSFPPGSTWQSLVVTVTGDTVFEPDETFYVSLSGATNATIEAAKGVGTIVNDDPSVSVDDVTVTEGHSGTTNATFTVRLSLASSQTVSVGIGTANGSASAGSDYVTASRTLSFSPGSTARGFTVVVNGDTAFEANETFFVNLSGATNATIVDGQGQGTILNDDSPPPPPAGPPFGSFDTPASGSTGVTGAIAVTGWALDNTGVTKVQVYRDPMPGEPTRPNGKVYIGDGTFVPGARPDIAAAFPAYPNADRAGWGYMLLTNMLPGQGNGPFVLYAYAYDGSGNTTLLGGKAITCSNATATKPFGTLDTPGQGQTVSGNAYSVFGWALTPQPGVIPTDGSTIQVYVDGVPRGHPTYDLYRADIATLFPGYANTNGAVGYFVLDTTALSNGIHSIAWSVTDNLGRTDGIGSRFFWVQN